MDEIREEGKSEYAGKIKWKKMREAGKGYIQV